MLLLLNSFSTVCGMEQEILKSGMLLLIDFSRFASHLSPENKIAR
jgi:hypothetical protein